MVRNTPSYQSPSSHHPHPATSHPPVTLQAPITPCYQSLLPVTLQSSPTFCYQSPSSHHPPPSTIHSPGTKNMYSKIPMSHFLTFIYILIYLCMYKNINTYYQKSVLENTPTPRPTGRGAQVYVYKYIYVYKYMYICTSICLI